MLIAKVVDDILICRPSDEIQAFFKDVSRSYKLNTLRTGSRVRISGMDIVTDNDGSTAIYVRHYLAVCSYISLSAQRRKQQEDELSEYNWNTAGELCCVPSTAAPCLSSRFRFMRGKC
jgi:hypothetical protein